jgi:RNA polymerase sigma-70 factor (ECF subfamily)
LKDFFWNVTKQKQLRQASRANKMKQQEFIALTIHFHQPMFRLAKRLLVSVDASKDAVQDVLLKMWEKKDELTHVNSLEAYAMQMTKNHCLDQLRLKSNQNLRLVYSKQDEADVEEQEKEETATWQNEKLKAIKIAIEGLPEKQKMIIQLRDFEGYEFDKIAEITGMTEVSIRVNLSRARKKLKDELVKNLSYGS